MKSYEQIPEKSYNVGDVFFWFDETGKINKIYDRIKGKDYTTDNENFPEILKAAAEKLDIFQIRELKARITERQYEKICDDVLVAKIEKELAAH